MTATTGRFSAEAEEWIDNLNRVIDELATERDRHREALNRIAFSGGGRFELIETFREIAREALVGLPE